MGKKRNDILRRRRERREKSGGGGAGPAPPARVLKDRIVALEAEVDDLIERLEALEENDDNA